MNVRTNKHIRPFSHIKNLYLKVGYGEVKLFLNRYNLLKNKWLPAQPNKLTKN
ncbi:hypothetical protein PMAN_b0410 [Pseudoalteromonas marina]|nr:hypothetical protein PMAN_b0410 [Pseudoalteromonas marina]